jgi:hypothetical protein
MRGLPSLLLLLVVVVVAGGCGGGKTSVGSTTRAESTTNAVTVTTRGQTLTLPTGTAQCDAKQITAPGYVEGSCVVYGVTITIVNKAHWLQRREYDARLEAVRTADVLHTASGQTIRPAGTFAVITLRIRNKLRRGLAFDPRSDLVFLTVNKTIYGERHDAELDPSLDSFAGRRTLIGPGEAATGTIVFDVPADQAEKIAVPENNLIFLNLADEGRRPDAPPKTMSYIRLWK